MYNILFTVIFKSLYSHIAKHMVSFHKIHHVSCYISNSIYSIHMYSPTSHHIIVITRTTTLSTVRSTNNKIYFYFWAQGSVVYTCTLCMSTPWIHWTRRSFWVNACGQCSIHVQYSTPQPNPSPAIFKSQLVLVIPL